MFSSTSRQEWIGYLLIFGCFFFLSVVAGVFWMFWHLKFGSVPEGPWGLSRWWDLLVQPIAAGLCAVLGKNGSFQDGWRERFLGLFFAVAFAAVLAGLFWGVAWTIGVLSPLAALFFAAVAVESAVKKFAGR